jgi:hypothetical protein
MVMSRLRAHYQRVSVVLAAFLVSGCMTAYKQSVGADQTKLVTKVFLTDYNTAWQAVLDALKSSQLDVTNREGGFIQTRWTENTAEKNFIDSFGGSSDAYLKAQYRFKVTAAKGFYNGKPSVRVTIQKDQVVQRDVLEGWRAVESDVIEENTLIYRIGRIILMRTKLARLEEDKLKAEAEGARF